MAETVDHQTYKRAAHAALLGLITQLIVALGVALLGLYGQTPALYAATWHLFAGGAIWLILWLTYKQHQLERLESLEAEQLAQSDEQAARLFDEAGQQLAIARKRLEGFYKWGLNGISLVVAGYLLAVGGALLWGNYQAATGPTALGLSETAAPLLIAGLSTLIAFVAFIVGRYVSGMTREPAWTLLRGGAGFMMGSALITLLIVIAALGAFFGQPVGFTILALAIPALMAVLGLEMLLALLLSIYRPRQAGQPMRPAFDSRILGWLSSPESIGRIVSETLNYQFGFEISRSWFYRLLARAVTPLLILGAVILIGLSSIVIVAPQQQALITTGGRIVGEPAGPGLHLKWPWPLGGAKKYNTARVKTIEVGSMPHTAHENFIWSDAHEGEHQDYLITAPPRVPEQRAALRTAIGELVGATTQVHYTIADLKQYATGAEKPRELVTTLAQRAMDEYFATHTSDALLAGGRSQAGVAITEKLQSMVDRHRLGLTITGVDVVHVHPPQGQGVVEAFHEAVAARQQKQTRIAEARKEAVQILASVAGSRQQAMEISQAKAKLDELRQQRRQLQQKLDASSTETGSSDSPSAATQPSEKLASLEKSIAKQRRHIETLIQSAGGEAARMLAEARAARWRRPLQAAGKAERFTAQLQAYQQAPRYYRMRQYLDVLGTTLKEPRKFLMTAEAKGVPTIRLNLESAGQGIEGILEQANE